MLWAGHDTTAAALSFAIYLLASHKDIQSDLRKEIKGIIERDGDLSFDNLRSASLLHAVMQETLRLHPPTLWTNRGLTEDIVLENENQDNSPKVLLKKGSCVFVPIWAV